MAADAGWAGHLQTAWLSRGPLAWCLRPAALLYGALAALHLSLFRLGLRATQRLPVPVIVVGNLVAGGAGKTPTVITLVRGLQQRGYSPGIVSRGYGRVGDEVREVRVDTPAVDAGDEPLLLRRRTGVPVVVARNRVAAVRELLRLHPGVDVLVSDDGLQHRRLGRDVQVLVFDERGAGNGWLLPAGPLREPMPSATPERTLVVYNAASPTTALAGYMAKRQLVGAATLGNWARGHAADIATLTALRGRPVLAAAGLARPERFFEMLRQAGLQITPMPLPDHHDFASLPWPAETADVIVTEKDAVKLDPARIGHTRVWVATLDFTIEAGFDAALTALLPPPPTRTPSESDHGNTTP